jgi:hypothetical protein
VEFIHLIATHSFDLFTSVAIVGSLLFAGLELRHVQKTQRVTNLLEITKQHRQIWSEPIKRPELLRILQADVDLEIRPLITSEALFATFLINHLNVSFQARKEKMYASEDAVHKDIKWIFSLPIPKAVWEKLREFQDPEFLKYVEANR